MCSSDPAEKDLHFASLPVVLANMDLVAERELIFDFYDQGLNTPWPLRICGECHELFPNVTRLSDHWLAQHPSSKTMPDHVKDEVKRWADHMKNVRHARYV